MLLRKFAPFTFVLTVVLAICGMAPAPAWAESPQVKEAWINAPMVPGRPGALYFTFVNPGPAAAIVAVETPAAKRAELHTVIMEHEVMKMRAVARVEVPAAGEVTFAPRGLHVMLFDVDETAMQNGAKVPVTVILEDGSRIDGEAAIVVKGAAHSHH